MKIGILGAGPAGLTFAYLMKRQNHGHEVTVIEQNPRGATWGFGVVFSGTALDHVASADAEIFANLMARAESWDDITIALGADQVPIDGNKFAAIARLSLITDLTRLCEEAGVEVHFDRRVENLSAFDEYDLVVGADGINSLIRDTYADAFQPETRMLTNAFVWYGTSKPFDTLTLTFRKAREGAFVAHHYRYAPDMSTFIVECDAATFGANAFETMDDDTSRSVCERIFAHELDGHKLISNKSDWRRFPVITNKSWIHDNKVILGDAAHTAHFSIGSGTRLAMEDAAILADAFAVHGDDVGAALGHYEAVRRPQVEKLLGAAAGSYNWYERFHEKLGQSALELAYDYMTRSGRVDDGRLRQMAPRFMAAYHAQQG